MRSALLIGSLLAAPLFSVPAAQAQEALAEANLLDPRSPEAWGMICVVCMTKAQYDEEGPRIARKSPVFSTDM